MVSLYLYIETVDCYTQLTIVVVWHNEWQQSVVGLNNKSDDKKSWM
jgi:hypothetical protein